MRADSRSTNRETFLSICSRPARARTCRRSRRSFARSLTHCACGNAAWILPTRCSTLRVSPKCTDHRSAWMQPAQQRLARNFMSAAVASRAPSGVTSFFPQLSLLALACVPSAMLRHGGQQRRGLI